MAATSLLARLGLRIATLGSAVNLAIAAPIAEGDVSQAAHTHNDRTGIYFPSPTSIGFVTDEVERMRWYADGGVQIGGAYGTSPGIGSLSVFGTADHANQRAPLIVSGAGSPASIAQMLHTTAVFVGVNGQRARVVIDCYKNGDSINFAPILTFRAANGTAAAPTAVRTGELLANLSLQGYDGTQYPLNSKAFVKATATAQWTTTAQPFMLNFDTTSAAEGNSTTTHMRIHPEGGVQIGGALGTTLAANLLRVSGNASSAMQTLPAGTHIVVTGADSANARVLIGAYGTGVTAAISGRVARGTNAAPTAVQTDDVVAEHGAWGYGTTGFSSAARAMVQMTAAETWTDIANGSRIGLFTTAPGTTTTTEKVRIFGDGGVQIGGAYTTSPGPGSIAAFGTIYASTDSLADAATVNYSAAASDNFTLLLTSAVGASRLLAAPTNLVAGMRWVIRVKQPASGGPCNLTYNAAYKFVNGFTPALSAPANAVDLISCYYDGTDILTQLTLSYGTSALFAVVGSSLDISGAVNLTNVLVDVDTTLDATHYTVCVDATAGPITITLPSTATSGVPGRVYNIKKVDASVNTVTIQRSGSDLIDGATSQTITAQYQARGVHARNSAAVWDVV